MAFIQSKDGTLDNITNVTNNYGTPFLTSLGNTTTSPTYSSKVYASDGSDSDEFGISIAVGDKIVVGTRSEAVYVYDLDGTNETKITASDGVAGDDFGATSVAIGDGKIVIGAVDDDDNGTNSGSVYIYDLDGTNETKITASDGAAGDRFGSSVSVGNGRIVVGAEWKNVDATNDGQVYVYDLNGTEIKKLTPDDPSFYGAFGSSVSVGNGRIVVGAPLTNPDGVGGAKGNGSAYVYDLNGNLLFELAETDDMVNASYGKSVSVGNGRIVIGAFFDVINNIDTAGSSYIYDLDGNLIKKITATNPEEGEKFGYSVSVSEGRIIIGAPGEAAYSNTGKTFIFDLDGTYITELSDPETESYTKFGTNVSVKNGIIIISAISQTGATTNTGAIFTYSTPSVLTPYDLFNLKGFV